PQRPPRATCLRSRRSRRSRRCAVRGLQRAHRGRSCPKVKSAPVEPVPGQSSHPSNLARAPELPADLAAEGRYLADDHQLRRVLRAAAAVDPKTLLDGEISPATAEIPWRRAPRAKDRAHSVRSDRRLDARREVEADSVRHRFADFLAALGDQLVSPAELLAVISEHLAALVDQAKAADIAVVAGLEPACVIVLAALDRHVFDAFS